MCEKHKLRDPSQPPSSKRRRVGTITEVQRRQITTISCKPLRLGVVTWNVAHFGEGDLDLLGTCEKVHSAHRALLRRPSRRRQKRRKNNEKIGFCDRYLRDFVGWLNNACAWRTRIDDMIEGLPEVESSKPWKKLVAAEARHRGEGRDKGKNKDDESDDEDSGKLADDDTGIAEPEALGASLIECWTKTEALEQTSERALRKIWSGYFKVAFEAYSEAWKAFAETWKTTNAAKTEIAARNSMLDDLGAHTSRLKELRAAAKMLFKPLLQLRTRANCGKAVQALVARELGNTFEVRAAKTTSEAACKASRWRRGVVQSRIIDLDKMTHRILIAEHIVAMFVRNPWLDAIILQEVNKGIDVLTSFLKKRSLICHRGLRLLSRKGRRSQTEYYPLVTRANDGIQVTRAFAVTALARKAIRIKEDPPNPLASNNEIEIYDEPTVEWNKSKNIYRPILAYDLQIIRGKALYRATLGVVHTSPAGSEFSRSDVYAQLDAPLRFFASTMTPTVIGGDFYLTAEAVTRGWRQLNKQERERIDEFGDEQRERLEARLKRYKRHLANTETTSLYLVLDSKSFRFIKVEEMRDEIERVTRVLKELGSDRIQLLRNDRDMCLSVRSRIEKHGLELAQPLSGTNWKSREVLHWFDAQIADFFVHTGPKSKHHYRSKWACTRTGLVDPAGGLVDVDDDGLSLSKYWRYCSDHFPVGGMFSRLQDDSEVGKPFHYYEGNDSIAVDNREVEAEVEEELEPRELLGFVNRGQSCYLNAALQLIARMGLANYRSDNGQLAEAGKAARDALEEVLETRRTQGEEPSYLRRGRYGYFTDASTLALANALVGGFIDSVRTQEDAGDALRGILGAYDKRVDGYNWELSEIVRTKSNQEFVQYRPSQLAFRYAITTTYDRGLATGVASGGVVTLGDSLQHKTYAIDNMVRVPIPSSHLTQQLGRLIDAGRTHEYDEDGNDEIVEYNGYRYAHAKRVREEIEFLQPDPARLLIQLKRFAGGIEDDVVESTSKSKQKNKDQDLRFGAKIATPVAVPSSLWGHDLRAFIVHHGRSAHSGHYTAYVHHNGAWYNVDDTQVIPCDDWASAAEQAYILYYE